ncbi:MAG TPA: hypothetical protein VGO62_02560 [Myxococcota bacterium]|jgi:hypothetical protein
MPIIDKVDPSHRSTVIRAFVADAALRHARWVWVAVAVISVVVTVGMLWWYHALDDNAWILAIPVVPGAAIVAVKLRDDGKQLPVALAGLGLSAAEKTQLAVELAADPEVRAQVASAGQKKLIETRPRRGLD